MIQAITTKNVPTATYTPFGEIPNINSLYGTWQFYVSKNLSLATFILSFVDAGWGHLLHSGCGNLHIKSWEHQLVDNLTLLGVAIALGMDAFAVALAVASVLINVTFRHIFRLTWHFGLFQSLMTYVGWLSGVAIFDMFWGLNDYIAFGLLTFIGLKMFKESGREEERLEGFDPTKGWSLVGLSVATSLDALAVGISFSLIGKKDILFPVLLIGFVAFVMTLVGIQLGDQAGKRLGKWAERVGGIVLIIIGAKILIGSLL
jgi:manganese efflux pump family protein